MDFLHPEQQAKSRIEKTDGSFSKEYSKLAKHSRFSQSYADLHARPFPVSAAPIRTSQLSFLHHDSDDENSEVVSQIDEINHLKELCQRYSIHPPQESDACFYQNFGEFEVRWERHTEFSTYAFVVHDSSPAPFEFPPIGLVPIDWLQAIPGQVIAAVHIDALEGDGKRPDREVLRQYFEGQRLIGSKLHDGAATIWSALRLHSDNFNRILLVNNTLNECQAGRVLRALLEIEAYRNMTLLAFPLAQEVSAKVSQMEAQLARLVEYHDGIRSAINEEEQLAELSKMAAIIAELIARSRYRFDAGSAYYQMVQSRLEELQEQETQELQTMAAFIDRKLSPSYRTVIAAKRRLDDLAERVDRASDFIRTRIDMAIETQNQALLKSMDRRAQMQFNLQQTVEGLSVVVLTYYVLALCGFLLDAADDLDFGISRPIAVAGLLPVVLSIVWLLSRRLKKRLRKNT